MKGGNFQGSQLLFMLQAASGSRFIQILPFNLLFSVQLCTLCRCVTEVTDDDSRLDRERAELSEQLERGNKEMEDKLRSESKQLKDKLEGESKHIMGQLEREKEEKQREQQRLEQEMINDKESLQGRSRLNLAGFSHIVTWSAVVFCG